MDRPLLALAIFAASASAASAQVKAGPEFRVNTQTVGRQGFPDVAAAPNGDFVVVWSRTFLVLAVYGQRYDAAGVPRGGELTVTPTNGPSGNFAAGRVAVAPNGEFEVVWGVGGGHLGLRSQRFASSGARLGAEFRVDVDGDALSPSIDMDASGNAVVAWYRFGPTPGDPDAYAILARRLSAAGVPLGGEILVNTYTTGPQVTPSVAVASDGAFVVVWASRNQDGSRYGVFGQRFDATGARRGGEFAVNTYTTDHQYWPAVASDPQGNFVVAWQTFFQDGSGEGVIGQRFDSSGARVGGEFLVNTFTTSAQVAPRVDMSDMGDFTVAWSSFLQDGSYLGAFAQRFESSGARRGSEFQVNTFTLSSQYVGGIAADAAGNFTVAYTDGIHDGNDSGVFAQRFGGLLPSGLRVDIAHNLVLEPGETADVRPTWRNVNGAPQSFGGALSSPGGPAGGVPVIIGPTAGYGTVPDGASAECVTCYTISLPDPVPRPAAHWDGAVTESVVPDIHGQRKRWVLHVGRSFADVPPSSGFYRFVETILHANVTAGCTAEAYCPSDPTTREQMAVFVLAAREPAGFVPPVCVSGLEMFSDVPAFSPFCRWVEELARRGVVGGCAPGQYCPTSPVTREQMAVFVLRTLDTTLDPPACGAPMFADVPASSGFCRWIEELARRGVVTGCGGGNYCPAASVTREQMAVFLAMTFGLTLYGV